jgi:hypothetical protein
VTAIAQQTLSVPSAGAVLPDRRDRRDGRDHDFGGTTFGFSAGSLIIQYANSQFLILATGLGVTIGGQSLTFGSGFFEVGSGGVAIGAEISVGSPQQIVPGIELYGTTQFQVSTYTSSQTITGGGTTYVLPAGPYFEFGVSGQLEIGLPGGATLFTIEGSFNVGVNATGAFVTVQGYMDIGSLGSMSVNGTLQGSAAGLLAYLEVGASTGQALSGTGFSFSASFQLEINTESSAQSVNEVNLSGNTVSVSLPANTIRIYAVGQLTILNFFNINGMFDLSVSPSGFSVAVTGNITVLGVQFNVSGGASITGGANGGFAAGLTASLNSGSAFTLPGFSLSMSFTFGVNTTSVSQTFGTLTIAAQSLEIAGMGTLELGGFLDLTGSFSIVISASGLDIMVNAMLNVPILGDITAVGQLDISSAGVVASIGLGVSLNLANVISLSGVMQLIINTTSSSQMVSEINVNSTTGAVSGTSMQSVAAGTLEISFGGTVTVGPFSISGGVMLVLSSTGIVLSFYASINLSIFGSLSVSGGAAIETVNGQPLFAMYVDLGTNALSTGSIGISGDFVLQINTGSVSVTIGSQTVAANSFFIQINASINLWVFTLTGSITLGYTNGAFEIDIGPGPLSGPSALPLSLNFFNFVNFTVSGYIRSDGTFSISGSASINFSLGPFSFDAGFGMTLSNTGFSGYAYGGLYIDMGLLGNWTLAGAYFTFDFDIANNSITISGDFDVLGISIGASYTWTLNPPPVLATNMGNGVLRLNMGVDSPYLGTGYGQYTSSSNEGFAVSRRDFGLGRQRDRDRLGDRLQPDLQRASAKSWSTTPDRATTRSTSRPGSTPTW